MNNIPKNPLKCNEFGLLENIDYIFNDDGTINYKEMLFQHPEFLVANKKNFEKRKQEIPENIRDINDRDLLVLLIGMKYIANIRQFLSVEYEVFSASSEFVSCKCKILWKGNYETFGKDIPFESMADASTNNTSSFARIYLTTIAENRAFVRCVRNFLRIPILGSDEIGLVNSDENISQSISTPSPIELLTKKMNERNLNLDFLRKNYPQFNKDWKEIKDINNKDIFSILGWINVNNVKK